MPTAIFILLLSSAFAYDSYTITLHDLSYEDQFSAQACVGLFNRDPTVAGSVYGFYDSWDTEWWGAIGDKNSTTISYPDLVAICVAELASGYISYDVDTDKEIIPEIITLAGVLSAVPVSKSQTLPKGKDGATPTLLFDIEKQWPNYDSYKATEYLYENHIKETTGLSMLNPGFNTKHWFSRKLEGTTNLRLVDYIVKQKLFNMYMFNACIPLTSEHSLMDKIAKNNPWENPIGVMGYNDAWWLGGDLFEAETACSSLHNMGQIASGGFNNLSYFSIKPPITEPMVQKNAGITTTFDPEKVYMAFIIGDGDNLDFVKGSRKAWMDARLKYCASQEANGKACQPLLWSLSPHLITKAPDMMQWYYDAAKQTGADFFVLPPSGHLYSYPGSFSDDAQEGYVKATEEDCKIMATSGSVTWEWFYKWRPALKHYLPRYDVNKITKAFYGVNVPFSFPTFPCINSFCHAKNKFTIVGEDTVFFHQREWRGTSESGGFMNKPYLLSAKDMADEINGYKNGTVSAIYTTSDGGFSADDLYEMLTYLDDRVEIVNTETLTAMAQAAYEAGLADKFDTEAN